MINSLNSNISFDMNPVDREHAIPLITFDTNTKKFTINENAEQILKKMEAPLGVISVAGVYRTGKSYLLNRVLLNRNDGFSVGPSINPCTKGLWIWPKTMSGYAPDGTPLNVLVIDTEGIGATDEDHNHDNKIFTLAILLSSYFIFNSLGSIDENAIQNLSFIVNITKNIQLHNSKHEDVDLRDIAKYLPSFMWVIRDFSLKLTDPEGEPITSKEYLEKSLELQKGYSETVETKNKIRTLIKEFFRERDCVTLVRPLTEEDNLQNLCRMDQSNLRPEFLEQINGLRKKVLHKIKPKSMNGKFLNGEMFCNIMKSYVNAINSGAVPVIENAWSYVCKNECNRAMNNALIKYIELMNENVKAHLPMHEKELYSHHQESKKASIDFYEQAAIGIYFEEYLIQLKHHIKERQLQFKIENEKETKKSCESFLENNFTVIKQNLMRNISQHNFSGFKGEVESFIRTYTENAPNGPGKNLFLYDFIINEILSNSEIFYNDLLEEFRNNSLKQNEEIEKLKQLINEVQSTYMKECAKNAELIKQLENEKSELILQDKSLRANASFIAKEKESSIKEFNERIDTLKRENEKKMIEMRAQMELIEESAKENEQEIKMREAKFEETKLLLEQKIKFLEKTVEELGNKEKEFVNEIKLLKKEGLTNNKEYLEKYETQMRGYKEKYEMMQEKCIDLETKLLEKERRLENERSKSEEQIEDLNKTIEEFKSHLNMYEGEVKTLENKSFIEKEKSKSEYEQKIAEIKEENEKVNLKLKETEEKFTNLKTKMIKDISMLKQSYEFSESQIKELKNKSNEDKNSNDSKIKDLEEQNTSLINSKEDLVNHLNELRFAHLKELNKFKSEMEEKEIHYKSELEQLNSLCSDWEAKFNNKLAEMETIKEEFSVKSTQYEREINDLTSKFNLSVNEKEALISENKAALEKLKLESDAKTESLLKQCRLEISFNNEKNEKSINEIRKHYEVGKENFDLKMKEETQKMNLLIQEIENESQEKLKELERSKEEKIEELEEKIVDLDENHNGYVKDAERAFAVKDQHIEDLNKLVLNTKENLMAVQLTHENMLEMHSQQNEKEKLELQNRIDLLNRQKNEKERENGCLFTKNEHMETTIENLKDQVRSIIQDSHKEKSDLNEKISILSTKLQTHIDELIKVKSDSSKEIALKIQELEFLNSKIIQMQKTIDENNAKTEEREKTIKETLEAEMSERIKVNNKEKLELETKLNQKKKELKEKEMNFSKDKSMLEREKAVFIEKFTTANKLKEELAESLEKEREVFEAKLKQAKEDIVRECEMTIKENEMMKNKLRRMENEYSELSATYEKDSNLWSTKFEFLEEQRKQARQDLLESQKKFEAQLENLSKKSSAEKDKMEDIKKVLFASIEQKFNSNLKELQENYAAKLEEANAMRKRMENENRSLLEKLNDKSSSNALIEMEKKLNTLSENENKLKKESSTLTEEKDKKIKELSNVIDNERAFNKEKIFDMENKLREHENKRNSQVMDIMKQNVVNEKDIQVKQNEIESLNERIRKIERQSIKLMNENKELIKEKEKLKRGSPKKIVFNNNSHIYPLSKFTGRFATANKENIRNDSNTSLDLRSEIKPYEDGLVDSISIAQPNFSSSKKTSQKSDAENLHNTEY